MDKSNLQMNSSGSEFALRVALCDLVQRLKRSEFMCKYLENCRNELANEVIKLRSHNNLLLKELIENPNSQNRFDNVQNSQPTAPVLQQNTPNLFDPNLVQNEYKNTIKLDSIVDESWEEITTRLINQLKKEILNAESEEQNQAGDEIQEKKSTLCSSGSNYFDLKSDQPDNMAENDEANDFEYETQEQHMAINDLDVKELKDTRDVKTKDKKDTQSIGNEKMKLTFKLLEDYSLNQPNNNLKVIEVHESRNQTKLDIHELLKNYLKQDNQTNQLDLVEKILHNYNRDLEEITRQIIKQNEKLVSMKGKKIRDYFRKQLDKNSSEPNSPELKIN